MANDDWEGAVAMHKALKALATSVRPISASRVKTAAATALANVKVNQSLTRERKTKPQQQQMVDRFSFDFERKACGWGVRGFQVPCVCA